MGPTATATRNRLCGCSTFALCTTFSTGEKSWLAICHQTGLIVEAGRVGAEGFVNAGEWKGNILLIGAYGGGEGGGGGGAGAGYWWWCCWLLVVLVCRVVVVWCWVCCW